MRLLRALVFLFPVFLLPLHASGTDLLPADRQALLFLKTLSFNKSLLRDENGKVKVVIVSSSGNAGGECGKFMEALSNTSQKVTVSGASVDISQAGTADLGALEKAFKSSVAGAYLCDETTAQTADIVALTRRIGILSFAPTAEQVKAGATIGLILRDGKAVILANTTTARQEGADLDPTLLRLAEVVK